MVHGSVAGTSGARGHSGPAQGGGAGLQADGTSRPTSRAAAAEPPQPPAQYYAVPEHPPDDCYFLHWVRLWLLGCTPVELRSVLGAVREGGAVREPALCADVTHVVFCSSPTAGELAELRTHLASHREQVRLCRGCGGAAVGGLYPRRHATPRRAASYRSGWFDSTGCTSASTAAPRWSQTRGRASASGSWLSTLLRAAG
jgi:hypothetical protein